MIETAWGPSVHRMFTCVRCSTPAAALMTFDYNERAVWLEELEPETESGRGYSLCTVHADRMTPPLAWTLTDRRNVTRLFTPSGSSEVA